MKTYEQRTTAILKKTEILMASKQKTKRAVVISSLAAVCSTAAVFAVLSAAGGTVQNEPDEIAALDDTIVTQVPETTEEKNANKLEIDGGYVNYSELEFNYEGYASYIDMADQTTDIAYSFSEELLADCTLVAKATVLRVGTGIWDCPEDVPEDSDLDTLVFTLRLDKIFYSDIEVTEGETFVIEQAVLGGTFSDCEYGLKTGGQYFLPIVNHGDRYSESEYGLVYEFEPMIEQSANGGYIFSDRWPSLFNDDTAQIIMDVAMADGGKMNRKMYLRADECFEADFKQIVDFYCG